MDDARERLKTEIVKISDQLAEGALSGKDRGVVLAWATFDGGHAMQVVGQMSPLEFIGLAELAKAGLVAGATQRPT